MKVKEYFPPHTRAHILEQEMDKIYAQAFREKRLGGGEKRAHAWGSLAPGGAGSSDTKRKRDPNPRQYPEPLFKLRRLQGGRGRRACENRQKLDVMSCVAVCFVVVFSST